MMSGDDFYERIGTKVGQGRRPGGEMLQTTASPSSGNTPDWTAAALGRDACWSQRGDAYFPISSVVEALPAGAYRVDSNPAGVYLARMPIKIDSLLKLPDGAVEEALSEFNKFWTIEPNFRKLGYLFKMGMLLWGPPGSGKTSAVWQMTDELVKNHNGIVLFIDNPGMAVMALLCLRSIEPNRPLITVAEDLDALVQTHGEHTFLGLYDGETTIDNVVHIATTNYIEFLDKRFVDRPSRFDRVMYVGMPSTDARGLYYKTKVPDIDGGTLSRWVRRSEGYSIAHMREVIVAVKCFGHTEDEVFARLDKMKDQTLESGYLGAERRVGAGFLACNGAARHP